MLASFQLEVVMQLYKAVKLLVNANGLSQQDIYRYLQTCITAIQYYPTNETLESHSPKLKHKDAPKSKPILSVRLFPKFAPKDTNSADKVESFSLVTLISRGEAANQMIHHSCQVLRHLPVKPAKLLPSVSRWISYKKINYPPESCYDVLNNP